MRLPLPWLLLGCAALNSAWSAEAVQANTNDAAARALYQTHCAACHDSPTVGAPTRAALELRTPAAIASALETGLMREQGRQLTSTERLLLAGFLGSKTAEVAGTKCSGTLELSGATLWNRWGNGADNRRYQPLSAGGIAADAVGSLQLKWAFAFPGAARARSQPAVTREAIFVGSQDGRVYALDFASGCTWWVFQAESEVRNAPLLGFGDDGKVERLYFGDFNANAYAVHARSGELIWKRSVKDHPAGTITGSVALHEDRLFVPMSSLEVVSAMDGNYECCKFRGGVTALDAKDGRLLWRMYTTAEARENGRNRKGVAAFGPSGAPVWSTPTIDAQRGVLYVGTGENYSSPATDMSDAIVAVELSTGAVRWVRQTTPHDAWNLACGWKDSNNCPKEDGPDFDFGAPPILASLADGGDILLAGQKSGMVFGLDPETGGKILWQQRAGAGGFSGGVHWGMASDGRTLFVGIADNPGNKSAVGPRRPGLHAFDAATGTPLWSRIEPRLCNEPDLKCETALSAPVTLTDGIVFAGTHNGLLRAYSTLDGRLLWTADTRREFSTVNGVKGSGGTIDGAGPVVAGGHLIVSSGYDRGGETPGNVLLVFGPVGAN